MITRCIRTIVIIHVSKIVYISYFRTRDKVIDFHNFMKIMISLFFMVVSNFVSINSIIKSFTQSKSPFNNTNETHLCSVKFIFYCVTLQDSLLQIFKYIQYIEPVHSVNDFYYLRVRRGNKQLLLISKTKDQRNNQHPVKYRPYAALKHIVLQLFCY